LNSIENVAQALSDFYLSKIVLHGKYPCEIVPHLQEYFFSCLQSYLYQSSITWLIIILDDNIVIRSVIWQITPLVLAHRNTITLVAEIHQKQMTQRLSTSSVSQRWNIFLFIYLTCIVFFVIEFQIKGIMLKRFAMYNKNFLFNQR